MYNRLMPGAPGANIQLAKGIQSLLVKCRRISDIRHLSPLPDEAQRLIDKVAIKVGTERLSLAKLLFAKQLTFPVTDPMAVMEIYSESVSKSGGASRSMLPNSRGENQLMDRAAVRVPLYCTWDDFNFNIRTLAASERAGTPLDTAHIEEAYRRVNESIEDATINGCGFAVNGNTAYGFLTHPSINTYQYGTGGEAWTASGHDGGDIVDDVVAMIQLLQDAFYYGPYVLAVPSAYALKLVKDYSSVKGDGTILERLRKIDLGGGPLEIITVDRLPANTTVLFQATSNVVDMIDGGQPTTISWENQPGFIKDFMVMSFIVPRIRVDYDGNCGIVVGSTTG